MADDAWSQTFRISSSTTEGLASAIEEEVMRLFAELRAPLHRYLNTLGLPLSDCEDVAQDSFLELFRHWRDGKPRDNPRAWVFRVARNLALKRRQIDRHFDALPAGVEPADNASNPEEQAAESQLHHTTRAVIGVLPPLDRQCLMLRAEGLRYREIAAILDISLGSVAASLLRTLGRIARATQPEK